MSGEVYYICFKEAARPKWFMRFLKRGFSHCFALQPYNGKWVKYEYGHGVLRVDVIDDVTDVKEGCIIIKHYRESNDKYFGIMSCVGFVKWACGIPGFSLTPYQLYKRLKK